MRHLLTAIALALATSAAIARPPRQCPCPPQAPPVPAAFAPAAGAPAELVQVCEGGVCRLVPRATSAPAVSTPFAAPWTPAPRQRWYPGKLLGR